MTSCNSIYINARVRSLWDSPIVSLKSPVRVMSFPAAEASCRRLDRSLTNRFLGSMNWSLLPVTYEASKIVMQEILRLLLIVEGIVTGDTVL